MDFQSGNWLLKLVFLLLIITCCASDLRDRHNVLDLLDWLPMPNSKARPSKDDEMCERQMSLLVDGYKKKELWALKVYDAWGKSQSGLFSGNLVNFGHFDQCLSVDHKFEDIRDGIFRGEHCLVFFADSKGINVTTDHLEDLLLPQVIHIELIRQYVNLHDKKIGTAMCVPEMCSHHMVKLIADRMLAKNNMKTIDYDQNLYCNTVNIRGMRNIDLFAALFFSFMFLLLVVSTAYDVVMRSKNSKQRLLFSTFSVYSNGLRLFETQESTSKKIISCVYGIRSISILIIIHGHRVQAYENFPMINKAQFLGQWLHSIPSAFSTSTPICVNTFFLLTGLLATTSFLRKLDKNGKLNPFRLYLHRYLRITPVLGATIFFVMSLQRFFGDGPYNKLIVEMNYPACIKYWWSAILHIQNIVNPGELCLPHTWYLSTDFQLFLFSPFVIYPLWKYGFKIIFILPLLSLASIAFIFIFTYEIGYASFHMNNSRAINYFYTRHIYVQFYARLCPFLMGVLTGYVLHKTQETSIKIPKFINVSLWFASISSILAIMIGIFPFHFNITSQFLNSFYIAMSQLGWSLSVSWIIFACHAFSGFVNSFLSLSVWKPLAKIGLSIYLTHVLCQIAMFGTQKQPAYYSEFVKTHLFFGDVVLSIGVAIIAYLTFEAPVLAIERSFLNTEKNDK